MIRDKYHPALPKDVYDQIVQALDRTKKGSPGYEGISAILNRYAKGEIDLDEAYYDLLEGGLIPMPQRCSMSAKRPVAAEDELRLKERIIEAIKE